MSPRYFDLTWTPSTAFPDLPTGRPGTKEEPYLAPAVYRHNPYTITFTLTDDDDPYVPEGEVFAQIRAQRLDANASPGDPLADWDVDIVSNVVTIHLTPEQTATLPSSCYWDIQEFIDDVPAATWYTGKIKAWGDITREAAP